MTSLGEMVDWSKVSKLPDSGPFTVISTHKAKDKASMEKFLKGFTEAETQFKDIKGVVSDKSYVDESNLVVVNIKSFADKEAALLVRQHPVSQEGMKDPKYGELMEDAFSLRIVVEV